MQKSVGIAMFQRVKTFWNKKPQFYLLISIV